MIANTIALAVSILVLVFSIAVYVYAVRSGLRMKREYEASHAEHLARMKKYAPVQPRWGSDGVRLPSDAEAQEMRVQAKKESDVRAASAAPCRKRRYEDSPYGGVAIHWQSCDDISCTGCAPEPDSQEIRNEVLRAIRDAQSWESGSTKQ